MKDTDSIAVRDSADGAILCVKAVPGASRDKIVGVLGDCLKVATSSAPEKGRANASIAKTLAKALGVSKRDVEIVAGLTNPRKEFRITGLPAADVRAILADLN
jgi:uncharacterized protein